MPTKLHRHRSKWTRGDVFAFEIVPGERLFGHVKLAVNEQCIRPKKLLTSSPLAFFDRGYLVEARRRVGDGEILIPAAFVFEADWEVVDNRPVDVEAVDFPQTLSMVGPKPHFKWGELELPIELSYPEYRSIESPPTLAPACTLVPLCLSRLGRASEIDRTEVAVSDEFGPGRVDLRLSAHREKVHGLLGDRIGERYASTALRYGYDLRRFYTEAASGPTVIACPYCNAIVPEAGSMCPTCGEDMSNDAHLKMSAAEMAAEHRKRCKACLTRILATASICPGCRAKQ